MDLSYFIFLSSGLFLGWSLGANDAANVFGTAVGTKMVRFRTAAVISSFFLILGAVYSGGGTTETLTRLGNVNALPGAFMVALSAAVSVYWMIKGGLPVSTSQAIVGAIIGWNFYSGRPTDLSIVSKIVSTWDPNIKVLFEHNAVGLYGENGVEGVHLVKRQGECNEERYDLPIDGFFLAIGHKPNSDIFKDYLDTDEVGYIITEAGTPRTKVPGVFAAGDVADPHYRQAITAAGSGCKAAIEAERYLSANDLL